jgi:hypothetical protein
MRGVVSLIALLAIGLGAAVQASEQLSIEDSIEHNRAIESIIWSIPLVSSKMMRDGLQRDAGVGLNDVAYFSKLQTWKIDFTTNNNTTPYIHFFWNAEKEPVVVEIPPSTADVGLVGTLLDFWQRSMIGVGAAGFDGGRGGRYLIMSPDYQGSWPEGYIAVYQKTYNGSATLRPIIKDTSQATLDKAAEFVKGIRIYPLSQAANPPETRHVDVYDIEIDGLPHWDARYFTDLNEILQEEKIEEKDLTFLGILASLGIQKGVSYNPDERQRKVFDAAAKDAHDYLRDRYLDTAAPRFYADRQWTNAVPKSGVMTFMDWQFPNHVNYDERGAGYFGFYTSFRKLGGASFYLKVARDAKGERLNGSNTYKLTIPANPPMRDFWSVIAYEADDATWIDKVPKAGVASIDQGIEANADGSVDIYFSPKSPKGKEANWVPTAKGDDFFLFFRLYGPQQAIFDKSWKLNDVVQFK